MRKQAFYTLRSCMMIAFICAVVGVGAGQAQSMNGNGKFSTMSSASGKTLLVDGRVALNELVTIGDAHLLKIADEFKAIATREEVIAGDWKPIKELLLGVAGRNVPGAMWFALPTGEYWSVLQNHVDQDLKSRPYFSRLLNGKTVVGDLVVSKSTGKNVAIVAVPVFDGKKVVGILGCSVYLDQLSEIVKSEMALPTNMIFFSFNSKPLLALVWDQGLIFNEPKDLGEEVDQAFREMLAKEKGMVSYSFRGKNRDVLFRKSPVTNWWYGFGIVKGAKPQS